MIILEDKEKKSLKERVELVTALFGCATAGIFVVKTFAETVRELKALVPEDNKKDKGNELEQTDNNLV